VMYDVGCTVYDVGYRIFAPSTLPNIVRQTSYIVHLNYIYRQHRTSNIVHRTSKLLPTRCLFLEKHLLNRVKVLSHSHL